MEKNNKTYGFTIAIKELRETVPNIFRYATAYKRLNNVKSTDLWNMFVEKPEDDKKGAKSKAKKPPKDEEPGPKIDPHAMEGESYNMCHYWSNFEIANLDWFRSKSYNDFFDMMDRSGGFWMERVSHLDSFRGNDANLITSGEMHRCTRWPSGLYWKPRMFTTSAILDIDTRQFSIVLPTLLIDSSLESHFWSLRSPAKGSDTVTMSTGKDGIARSRMVWAADVAVTRTLSMWKEKKGAASENGSRWLAAMIREA